MYCTDSPLLFFSVDSDSVDSADSVADHDDDHSNDKDEQMMMKQKEQQYLNLMKDDTEPSSSRFGSERDSLPHTAMMNGEMRERERREKERKSDEARKGESDGERERERM